MSVQAFGMVEMVGYAVAVVLAIAAVAYFVTHHVREVRGELTGATARAAIQEMREEGVSRFAAGALATPSWRGGALGFAEAPSGSLHVRFFGRRTTGMTGAQAEEPPSESDTTLLEDVPEMPKGQARTRATETVPAQAPKAPSESDTTLLSQAAGAPGSESMTTLLGGEGTNDSEQR